MSEPEFQPVVSERFPGIHLDGCFETNGIRRGEPELLFQSPEHGENFLQIAIGQNIQSDQPGNGLKADLFAGKSDQCSENISVRFGCLPNAVKEA